MTNPTPRPLEVLTAEKALGWSTYEEGGYAYLVYGGVKVAFTRRSLLDQYIAKRLRSWSGLGLVVEAMEAKGWRLNMKSFAAHPGLCAVTFEAGSNFPVKYGQQFYAKGDPGPGRCVDRFRATQLAALRALGVDEETIQRAVEVT